MAMYGNDSNSLKAEIERRRQDLMDQEWLFECLLDTHEDSAQWGSEEAAMERTRLDALADAEIRTKLNTLEFGDAATRRLDYLLSVAFTVIGIYHRRRGLSLCEEIERRGARGGSGPIN